MDIYLDMDGVLTDYGKHILAWGCDWKGDLYHHLPPHQWTEEQATNDKKYRDAMADPKFWSTMPPMADAYVLWSFCRGFQGQPKVLTATPTNAHYRDRCATDKLATIHRYFDPTFPHESFHAVLRSEKKQYAAGNLLVDDMRPNCEEWVSAGGTAILHTDAITTITKLRELLNV